MKTAKFFFFALAVGGLFITGCGNDDDDDGGSPCTKNDFIDTFTGTNCDGEVIMTLTDDPDGLNVEIREKGGATTEFLVTEGSINGCTAQIEDPSGLASYELTLDGDDLTGEYVLFGDACEFDVMRADLLCTAQDFLGTYTGSSSCQEAGDMIEVTIREDNFAGFEIEIEETFAGGGSSSTTLGFSESSFFSCELEVNSFGTDIDLVLDGDNLSGILTESGDDCTLNLTRN